MPDRTIEVSLTLTMDEADSRNIGAVAEEDFGVEGAADMTLPHLLAAIVRNTLDAQLIGFGVPVTVVDVEADEIDA